MKNKKMAISTRFSILSVIIIVSVVTIAAMTTRFFFARNCLDSFHETSAAELTEFSDSITMFFKGKEVELNVFAESDAVKASDDSIHSFVNETGTIQILGYKKSRTEEEIRKLRKEIGFLSSSRREIVYSFYYEGKSIAQI